MFQVKRRIGVHVPQDEDEDELENGEAGEDEEVGALAFSGLHWVAAGLFLAAGAEAALRQDSDEYGPLRWAPLVTAPAAGVAHLVRAVRPAPANRTAVRLMDGLALGIGLAAATVAAGRALRTEEVRGWRRRRRGARLSEGLAALAPLTFGATGVLGMVLDREEREDEEEHRRLQRRASFMERLVPRRRTKIDRIVVHV